MTKIYSEGLLLLPIPSVPLSSSYRVTKGTIHIIRIFSLTGFVFFLFQSLMLLYAIPVFSENSFGSFPAYPAVQKSSLILSYVPALSDLSSKLRFLYSLERQAPGYNSKLILSSVYSIMSFTSSIPYDP